MAEPVDPAAITRSETGSKGSYRLMLDGHTAEMTYSRASARLVIIDHTEVPEGLRGRGAGQALVGRVVEDARADGFRIVPLCPFAASQFRRNPDYADVLSR